MCSSDLVFAIPAVGIYPWYVAPFAGLAAGSALPALKLLAAPRPVSPPAGYALWPLWHVGAAFVELVGRQADAIEARTGVRLEVTKVAVRNLSGDRTVQLADGVLTDDTHAQLQHDVEGGEPCGEDDGLPVGDPQRATGVEARADERDGCQHPEEHQIGRAHV